MHEKGSWNRKCRSKTTMKLTGFQDYCRQSFPKRDLSISGDWKIDFGIWLNWFIQKNISWTWSSAHNKRVEIWSTKACLFRMLTPSNVQTHLNSFQASFELIWCCSSSQGAGVVNRSKPLINAMGSSPYVSKNSSGCLSAISHNLNDRDLPGMYLLTSAS